MHVRTPVPMTQNFISLFAVDRVKRYTWPTTSSLNLKSLVITSVEPDHQRHSWAKKWSTLSLWFALVLSALCVEVGGPRHPGKNKNIVSIKLFLCQNCVQWRYIYILVFYCLERVVCWQFWSSRRMAFWDSKHLVLSLFCIKRGPFVMPKGLTEFNIIYRSRGLILTLRSPQYDVNCWINQPCIFSSENIISLHGMPFLLLWQ